MRSEAVFAKFGQLLPQSGSGRVGWRKGVFAAFGAREVLDFGVVKNRFAF